MDVPNLSPDEKQILDRLSRLEERITHIEEHFGLAREVEESTETAVEQEKSVAEETMEEDELEVRIGETWFAKVGIIVIAIGMAFVLTFPFEGLPAAAPGLLGYLLVGAALFLAHFWRESFELVSRYLRGAGMALFYFTTLRLYFFTSEPVLSTSSFIGMLILVIVVLINLLIAFRRNSVYLVGLSLTTGYLTAIVVGSTWFTLPAVVVFSILAVHARLRYDAAGLVLHGIALTYFTYFLWALGNPVLGNKIQFVTSPLVGLFFLLVYAVVFAVGTLLRPHRESEQFKEVVCSSLNAGLSYGLFLLHTIVSFETAFVVSHMAASVVFLVTAVVFWEREHSRYSTFLYAMLGYSALSVAIIKGFSVPNVFVWLSLQSIVVVGTAIWFRSRFIVVANFVIYLAVIIGYATLAQEESGISLGFGLVALLSARILNWQQHRLELRTEFMRNAYLAAAFVVFPYAMYHLVPQGYVSLSWVGIGIFYYLMNFLVKKQKYRWMGHLTLLLTVLYVLIIGIIQLEPTYRILSFLVLGSVLVAVSLFFTRLMARKRSRGA